MNGRIIAAGVAAGLVVVVAIAAGAALILMPDSRPAATPAESPLLIARNETAQPVQPLPTNRADPLGIPSTYMPRAARGAPDPVPPKAAPPSKGAHAPRLVPAPTPQAQTQAPAPNPAPALQAALPPDPASTPGADAPAATASVPPDPVSAAPAANAPAIATPAAKLPRPVDHRYDGALTVTEISRFKSALRLTREQEPYWPPVASLLRELGRMQIAQIDSGQKLTYSMSSDMMQRFYTAASPLLQTLREDQKGEIRRRAKMMGLEAYASYI